jgi:hypothetical protein
VLTDYDIVDFEQYGQAKHLFVPYDLTEARLGI